MNLSVHLITSLILSILLYPYYGVISFLVILGGFFIDVDHYLQGVFYLKTWNIKRVYRFRKTRDIRYTDVTDILDIFHTVEFWLLLAIVSYFYTPMIFVSIGVLLHIVLDLIWQYHRRSLDARAFSALMWVKRRVF